MTASRQSLDVFVLVGVGKDMPQDGMESVRCIGPLLLLGAPGVGKGTQAKLLMDRFAIPQISTGDLLRDNVARGTDLGREADALMREGRFVPDEVVNAMVAGRLASGDTSQGYILDGYPRTVAQAFWLDDHLAQKASTLPLIAIGVVVPEGELVERVTGRRSCPVCHRIYNVHSAPPQVAGICDVEGATLLHRSDDTVDAFSERLREFHAKTAGVIQHYREIGRFREVRGSGSIPEIAESILSSISGLRRAATQGS